MKEIAANFAALSLEQYGSSSTVHDDLRHHVALSLAAPLISEETDEWMVTNSSANVSMLSGVVDLLPKATAAPGATTPAFDAASPAWRQAIQASTVWINAHETDHIPIDGSPGGYSFMKKQRVDPYYVLGKAVEDHRQQWLLGRASDVGAPYYTDEPVVLYTSGVVRGRINRAPTQPDPIDEYEPVTSVVTAKSLGSTAIRVNTKHDKHILGLTGIDDAVLNVFSVVDTVNRLATRFGVTEQVKGLYLKSALAITELSTRDI